MTSTTPITTPTTSTTKKEMPSPSLSPLSPIAMRYY